MLRDLLSPETSMLYRNAKFLSLHPEPGIFKQAFFDELSKGDYPNLKNAMNYNSSPGTRTDVYIDSSMEIFSNSSGISIYFPYSDNFEVKLTTEYFDNINTSDTGYTATIVNADREADTAIGSMPFEFVDGKYNFKDVLVDDNYCEKYPTHIVGVGAEPIQSVINGTTQIYLVFIGDVKCTHQFDRLISFTGNGGGSELRFTRGDAYLQTNTSGQITNFQNSIPVNLKRKDIKHGNWKTVNSIWDSNWETDNPQQIFGIYEEDTQGSKTFSGSLTSNSGTFGYSITVQTQDDIIRQLNWDRTSFYMYNQGGLNNGCGTRNGWTVYDCNSYVVYTMPTQ